MHDHTSSVAIQSDADRVLSCLVLLCRGFISLSVTSPRGEAGRGGRLIAFAFAFALAFLASHALAGSIVPTQAAVVATEDGYVLAAEFDIKLGARFEDAITRGVPLYFNLEFVLEKPRKYWLSEHIVTRTQYYRLTYSSLTRQYRLTTGNLHQNFASLTDALRIMSRVNALSVCEKDKLKPGEPYAAALRLTLDRSQLPKPFQVDAITDRDWHVESSVLRWELTAPATPAVPQ